MPQLYASPAPKIEDLDIHLILEDENAKIPPLTRAFVEPDWNQMINAWPVLYTSTVLCKLMEEEVVVMDQHVGEEFYKFMKGRSCEEDLENFLTLELRMSQCRLAVRTEIDQLKTDIKLHEELIATCESAKQMVSVLGSRHLDVAKYEQLKLALHCEAIPSNLSLKRKRYTGLVNLLEDVIVPGENTMKVKIESSKDLYESLPSQQKRKEKESNKKTDLYTHTDSTPTNTASLEEFIKTPPTQAF